MTPDDPGLVTVTAPGAVAEGAQDHLKLLPELLAHGAVDSEVQRTGDAHEGVYD